MAALEKVRMILTRSTKIICENLAPEQLLREMLAKQALTGDEVKRIKIKQTESEQSDELISVLARKPATSYDAFMAALLEISRNDIYGEINKIEREVGYERQDPSDHVRIVPTPLQNRSAKNPVQNIVNQGLGTEARQKQIVDGPWVVKKKFGFQEGKLKNASDMALTSDERVVIADKGASKIRIYNTEGTYINEIKTSEPRQIAVSSDMTCFVANKSDKVIKYMLGDGMNLKGFTASCQQQTRVEKLKKRPRLRGLKIDQEDCLLIADREKSIHRYKHDGTGIGSIPLPEGITPRHFVALSENAVVISDGDTAPQVISNGIVKYTFNDPGNETEWDVKNIYLHNGIVFVSMPNIILCYKETGVYIGSIDIKDIVPKGGIVMTADSKTLLVCERESVSMLKITK